MPEQIETSRPEAEEKEQWVKYVNVNTKMPTKIEKFFAFLKSYLPQVVKIVLVSDPFVIAWLQTVRLVGDVLDMRFNPLTKEELPLEELGRENTDMLFTLEWISTDQWL